MQFLIVVLNKVELLESLLQKLADAGISGATILNSTGMMRELARNTEDLPIFGSLRFHLDPERNESKTLFMALDDTKIESAKAIIREVVGDISKPDTAVMFTLPILTAEGVEY
jgi:hypothetical protein